MAKVNIHYHCTECGTEHSKWVGQCNICGKWNTIVQSTASKSKSNPISSLSDQVNIYDLDTSIELESATPTGLGELDRVLGGGIVPASAILVGGDPGIGKSTLLLQASAAFSSKGEVFYFTGEETLSQILIRAKRLGISEALVKVAAATNLREILASVEKFNPDLVILDSIQTMWSDSVDGAPGSINQVRSVGYEIVQFAKRSGSAVVLVGHVTKEGHLAGPRVVEHMVDTVLYFEGELGHQYRILRSVKNRFGPVDGIGVFEMSSLGLNGVENPSSLFLSDHAEPAPGSVVFAGIEGSRPLLVEIQALVAPSAYPSAKRTVVGWDNGRLATVLAVLEAHCGIKFTGQDVYLNVAGGLRLSEPAADLAVASALLSAKSGRPLPENSAVFGEISLSGSIRPVPHPESRLKECAKLGFNTVFMPISVGQFSTGKIDVNLHNHLSQTVAIFCDNIDS